MSVCVGTSANCCYFAIWIKVNGSNLLTQQSIEVIILYACLGLKLKRNDSANQSCIVMCNDNGKNLRQNLYQIDTFCPESIWWCLLDCLRSNKHKVKAAIRYPLNAINICCVCDARMTTMRTMLKLQGGKWCACCHVLLSALLIAYAKCNLTFERLLTAQSQMELHKIKKIAWVCVLLVTATRQLQML